MNKTNTKRLSLTACTPGATPGVRINARLFVGLLILATCTLASSTRAQSCNPATVSYIVRDENGRVLGEAALKSVYEQLPKRIGETQVEVGETALTDDGKTFYWPESADWPKGRKVAGLEFINSKTCTMHLTEATLTYHNQQMRLFFNLEITRTQADRRPVIDSLPFQEGTFALDLTGWSHDRVLMIPSARWKKVQDHASAWVAAAQATGVIACRPCADGIGTVRPLQEVAAICKQMICSAQTR